MVHTPVEYIFISIFTYQQYMVFEDWDLSGLIYKSTSWIRAFVWYHLQNKNTCINLIDFRKE